MIESVDRRASNWGQAVGGLFQMSYVGKDMRGRTLENFESVAA